MTRCYGRAPRGHRLVSAVPHGHWTTSTFLAALRHDAITAPCVIDGPINGETFRAYVQQFLVPTLAAGDIVIMDNLGSHKGHAVRRAIRAVGARTIDALWRAIGDICALYSEQECWNYLKDAGYAPD